MPLFDRAPGLGSLFGAKRAAEPIGPDHTTASERFAQQRRSRVDIYFDVLTAVGAEGETKPTQLMFKTILCWKSMWDTLAYLAERRLGSSTQAGARRLISITPIGRACLERFYQARSFLLAEPSESRGSLPSF